MTFLHIAFLGGAAAIAVPILLHLLMRRQTQHLEFPALRFIKLRENTNRRQMKLRHWLLLALRCAILALLALALARPSIQASGMLADQEAPVAAAFVFDTNPRLQYRQNNQSRLEAAQQMATWLLPQLPTDSDVAVVDSRTGTAVFAVDASAARQRIERLDATTMVQPLSLAIEAAVDLLTTSPKERKEIYIFTDLSRAAWSREAMGTLSTKLGQLNGLGIYLIDVGVVNPSDFGIAEATLSSESLSKNSPLNLQAHIVHIGEDGQRTVELYLIDGATGTATVRGRQIIEATEGQSNRADFQVRGLGPGLHQGYVKIEGQDALACDDTHWFSVAVRPAWRVLIAAPTEPGRKPADYALFLSEALSPYSLRAKGEAAFECDVIGLEELAGKELGGYGAVCLVDPKPLEPPVWQKLHAYVSDGGGLGIFLGHNATPVDAFNEPLAQQLLPGKLLRQWRSDGDVYLAPENLQHPVLAKFRGLNVAWQLLPIFRHWQLGELAEGAATVIAYSNNQPAIVDRPVGKGRVITSTTSVSDAASRAGARNYVPWNLLPTGDDKFPFFLLANTITEYLVGSGNRRLNYATGDTAVVALGDGERHPIYVFSTPRGDQIRTSVDDRQDAIVVTSTEAAGNYRLQAGGEQATQLGFSVNLPASVSQLERVTPDDLKLIFGETPFRLARDRESIDRNVNAVRVGRELFPYLMILLVLILAAEQVVSNRFYQDYDTKQQRSRVAELASGTHARASEPEQAAAETK